MAGGRRCAAASNPGDDVCSSSAGVGDYANRATYEGMLRGAQVIGHLYGGGEDWHFNYTDVTVTTNDAGQRVYTMEITYHMVKPQPPGWRVKSWIKLF